MAKNSNDDSSIVRSKKPRAVELNKQTIMLAAMIAGVLILFAFLFSINTGNQSSSKSQSPDIKSHTMAVDTDVEKVGVDSYEDSKKIDKVLGLNKKPKVVQKIPDDLKKQISALRSQQSELKSELSRLRSKKQPTPAPTPEPEPTSSPMDKEAMQAAVFFPGGAPSEESKKKKKKEEKQDEQNKKMDQKERFMEGEVNKDVTNSNTVQYPISKYTIFAGTVIPGVLKSKLVSTLPGNIVAIVNRDVYDSVTGKHLLIPRGSTLIGQYNDATTAGEYQLQAKFLRLIRPDGSSIVLPNQPGIDGMGASGFSDTVDNHWAEIIGAGALSAIFSIPTIASRYAVQGETGYIDNGSGFNYNAPDVGTTMGAAGLGAIGRSTEQIGSQIASRALSMKPTITIHEGYQFNILVTKDIVIPPPGKKIDIKKDNEE